MADSNKRKERPSSDNDKKSVKRSKGGSGGRWQTPHQKAKSATLLRKGRIEPGDAGIWVTCAKGQEGRATEELKSMFEDCAERIYGIVPVSDEIEDENGLIDDIESSIRKEIASMDSKQGKPKLFSPVHVDLPCVLFFKTEPPIDPVDFVHKICQEIISTPGIRRMRYVNRLTPMTWIGKATEKGLEEVGMKVLGEHFELSGNELAGGMERADAASYAIRPTIRNHNTLSRDMVIQQTASLVGATHKVNLTKPDKVIIVEVFQTVCGMSVVESDWEKLKRFNLTELYPIAPKAGVPFKAGAMPNSVNTDDSRVPPAPEELL